MQAIVDFFVDPLIVPIYYYLAGYGLVWFFAFWLARIFSDPNTIGSYDKGTARAWRIAIAAHILGGTILVVWLCFKAIPYVVAWWHIPFYLIPYLFFIVVDIFFLLSLIQGQTQKRKTTQKSGGPRKRRKAS